MLRKRRRMAEAEEKYQHGVKCVANTIQNITERIHLRTKCEANLGSLWRQEIWGILRFIWRILWGALKVHIVPQGLCVCLAGTEALQPNFDYLHAYIRPIKWQSAWGFQGKSKAEGISQCLLLHSPSWWSLIQVLSYQDSTRSDYTMPFLPFWLFSLYQR